MTPPTVLIVDDQEQTRQLAATTLQMCGYSTITARDGVDALKYLSTHQVDLMLTDWIMPQMSGAELVKHVAEKHKKLPIVVFSCSSTSLESEVYESMGVHKWIKKPFKIKDLQSVIIQTLNDHQHVEKSTLA